MLINRTKDLTRMSLPERISLLNSYEMDDKQRLYNHTSSYNNGVVSSNTALFSQHGARSSFQVFPPNVPSYSGFMPATPIQTVNPAQSAPTLATSGPTLSTSTPFVVSKEFKQNMAFLERVMNCNNAFVARKLTTNNIRAGELNEVHPYDIEEMDITW
ncbi:hypothetical protein Hanom_Chr11g01000061 [Helianthus anomalus]